MGRNEKIIRRWFDDIWHAGKIEVIAELLGRKGLLHDSSLSPKTPKLKAKGFEAYCRATRQAFPNIRFRVDAVVESGEQIAARVTMTGTHKGEGLGIPPTGRKVRIQGMVMARIRGGIIEEGWNSFDLLGFYEQLGLVERPKVA